MRTTKPKITSRKNPGGTLSFCVDAGFIDGKRHRRSFRSKIEAREHRRKMIEARKRDGNLAFSLTSHQQIEAAKAFKALECLETPLMDAVQYFIKHAKPKGGRKLVPDAVAEFLSAKQVAGKKPRYIKELRCKLSKFSTKFAGINLNEVSREAVEEWLGSMTIEPLTRKNYLRDLGILFRFAQKRFYCVDNIVEQIEKPRVIEKKTEIFEVIQVALLLFAARTRPELGLVPYLAIGFFAGLRAAELEQLDWNDINLPQRRIEVKAASSKTSRHRNVEISDNLAAWLEPRVKMEGPVVPRNLYRRRHALLERAGIETWPENAMRHSFGSYHCALHDNASFTAAQMGNSTRILFQHYRQLTSKDEAKKYWAIKPPGEGEARWALILEAEPRAADKVSRASELERLKREINAVLEGRIINSAECQSVAA